MIHLPINLDTFGFVQREKNKGISVRNKCGRDFLYYALHYYAPQQFNQNINNPEQIDSKKLFGVNFKGAYSALFAWTQIQFFKLPMFLKSLGFRLEVNKLKVNNFFKLVYVLLFSRMKYEDGIKMIESRVDTGKVSGVDIALKFGGLLDHVMFVYGYDEENLYVFDTHQLSMLEYEKLTPDNRFYMKLPKVIIQKRWKRWSRVWSIETLD